MGVEYMIQKEYFEDSMMGNLTAMQPGLIDLLSVFFLKASSYEFMAQNSKYNDSYWYAFDYQPTQKTVFNLLFMSPDKKAEIRDSGVCHGDELIYMFDMELPLLLCDIAALLSDVTQCFPSVNECLIDLASCIESGVTCIINPDGPVRTKWHDCFTGQLTEEELLVSSYISQMWVDFASTGDPGMGAAPWDTLNPVYTKITNEVQQHVDYRKEYHFASDQASPSTTSTTSTSTSTQTPTPTTSSAEPVEKSVIILLISFACIGLNFR